MKPLRFIIFILILILISLAPARAGDVYDAVRFLKPDAKHFIEFEVRDNVITFWDAAKLGPQPTPAQIDQAKLDLAALRLAAQTQRQQEQSAFEAAMVKINANQPLTQADLNAVLKALIRRSQQTQQILQTLR